MKTTEHMKENNEKVRKQDGLFYRGPQMSENRIWHLDFFSVDNGVHLKDFSRRSGRVRMYFLVKSDLKLYLAVVFTCRGTGLEEVTPGKRTLPSQGWR